MKGIIFTLFIFIFASGPIISAQTVPDSLYDKRLYYTGKVWGFLKYFHSEVAKGNKNWDKQLFIALEKLKNDESNDDFNNTLLALIDSAGTMEKSNAILPDVPDSLKFNLDFSWFKSSILLDTTRSRLDTIRSWFRPQANYYVGEAFQGGNPTFDNDAQFYQWGLVEYPDEEHRLLTLFRYWNIINYFYPYKNIIDQNWDSTLVEFIPKIINTVNAKSFHLSFLELTTRINDSHAFTNSHEISSAIRGYYFLPFTLKFVENETVITGVFNNSIDIKVGDIIKSINNISIYKIRDSLRKYRAGSNISAIERDVNTDILIGNYEIINLTIENGEGQKKITVYRNITSASYYSLIANKGPAWKIIQANNKQFGYVNMGKLTVAQIDSMFINLWNTDAIIFDIRNYPNGTMWYMVDYFFDKPINIADFTVPNIQYPGTLFWNNEYVGSNNSTPNYEKPIFILFDESTQSQAEYTIMAFEQDTKAIKIGSQTAGADGNVSEIYLPGGIYTYFTGLGTFYPDFTPTQRVGIIPDIEVLPTIQGIRDGRDEVLETALNYNITDVKSKSKSEMPEEYTLSQNYPNPFNPTTTIKYSIPKHSYVTLKIYDILGKEITTLVKEEKPSGNYQLEFSAKGGSAADLPSGVYFYRIRAGSFNQVRKMMLIK